MTPEDACQRAEAFDARGERPIDFDNPVDRLVVDVETDEITLVFIGPHIITFGTNTVDHERLARRFAEFLASKGTGQDIVRLLEEQAHWPRPCEDDEGEGEAA